MFDQTKKQEIEESKCRVKVKEREPKEGGEVCVDTEEVLPSEATGGAVVFEPIESE